MRKCTNCKAEKPLSEFNQTRWICKPCAKAYDAGRRGRSGFSDNSTDAARAKKRKWKAAHPDPLKDGARQQVHRAIASGAVKPADNCETCGGSPKRSDGARAVQAHHDDYNKPLTIRWLCAKCHTKEHRAMGSTTSGAPE